MVSLTAARKAAMAYDGVEEMPHFEKTSFRIRKKIFLTLDEKNKRACIRLSPEDQDIFSHSDNTIIYPVPNKWGLQGWTFVDLPKVKKEMFDAALDASFHLVSAGKKKR